jgi:endogenous inhibitor of DNA gyrase (YacG/DUF329 family)
MTKTYPPGEHKYRGEPFYCKECKILVDDKRIYNNKNFCSQKCYATWWQKELALRRDTRECPQCGNKFVVEKSHPKKFCSIECWYNSLRREGVIHRRKWAALREKILLRDKVCHICGSDKQLVVHHIKPWKNYPDLRYEPSNLITWCRNCHNNYHNPEKLKMERMII